MSFVPYLDLTSPSLDTKVERLPQRQVGSQDDVRQPFSFNEQLSTLHAHHEHVTVGIMYLGADHMRLVLRKTRHAEGGLHDSEPVSGSIPGSGVAGRDFAKLAARIARSLGRDAVAISPEDDPPLGIDEEMAGIDEAD